MDPGIRPISNHRQYSPYVQQKSLATLKWVSPICMVLAIINIIIGLMWYSFNGLTEYLLVGLNNIAILLLCIFSLYWSFTYVIISDVVNQQESFPISAKPYLHALFTQILCAIQSGIVLSLIEYNSYNQFILILPTSILQIFFLLYIANVSRQFNVREYGVQRLIVYGANAVNLIFLGFAAYNLKQVIQQINLQLITISQTNMEINLIKISLLIIFITTILLSLFNLRRIKIYFVLLSFIVISVCIITSCVNGLLIRQVQKLEIQLSTNQGCKYAMQTISETSLKKDLECPQKYFDLELSPYLPCEQDLQTYQWEQSTNKLGCINTSCCNPVKKFVFNPINNLTIWINLIIMIGIVQAFNAAMLSEGSYKRFRMHIVGDGAMFIILLLLFISVVIIYNFSPDLGVQVQHSLVKQDSILNQVTILPTPKYSNFDKQKRLVGFYNLQSCEKLQILMLQQINFKSDDNKKGINIAIQGTNGQFIILNNFNSENLKIVQQITDKIFTKPGVPYDEIIIKGNVEDAEKLYKESLYFCTDNPLNSDFNILTEFYDITRLLQATKDQQSLMSKALKFYEISITVEDASNFQIIPNAEIKLYEGRFIAQSCQIITQLDNEMYKTKTDDKGVVKFNNLSQGNAYTIFILKNGFKKTCSVIDLSRRNPKTSYILRLTKDIPKHSVRVLLEWTSKTLDLDLYGIFKVDEHECITGQLSKSCGGMDYNSISKDDQHVEVLNINQLEPQSYTIFVKRFMTRLQVIDVISKTGVNQDWIDSDPHVTVYLSEISYPLMEFRLPQLTNSLSETADLTWMVFSIDGVQTDAPVSIQKLTNQITNEEIRTNTASNKPFWPKI